MNAVQLIFPFFCFNYQVGKRMRRFLRLKCKSCGHWNRIEVNKVFIEQPYPIEPRVKALIPMYEPLKTETCKKCGKLIAQPKELIRIVKTRGDNGMSLREKKFSEIHCPLCTREFRIKKGNPRTLKQWRSALMVHLTASLIHHLPVDEAKSRIDKYLKSLSSV